MCIHIVTFCTATDSCGSTIRERPLQGSPQSPSTNQILGGVLGRQAPRLARDPATRDIDRLDSSRASGPIGIGRFQRISMIDVHCLTCLVTWHMGLRTWILAGAAPVFWTVWSTSFMSPAKESEASQWWERFRDVQTKSAHVSNPKRPHMHFFIQSKLPTPNTQKPSASCTPNPIPTVRGAAAVVWVVCGWGWHDILRRRVLEGQMTRYRCESNMVQLRLTPSEHGKVPLLFLSSSVYSSCL